LKGYTVEALAEPHKLTEKPKLTNRPKAKSERIAIAPINMRLSTLRAL
jgi:hypothetical protein